MTWLDENQEPQPSQGDDVAYSYLRSAPGIVTKVQVIYPAGRAEEAREVFLRDVRRQVDIVADELEAEYE